MLSDKQKGRLAEHNVSEVLAYMESHDLIRGYRQTRPFSRADRHAVDFYIFITDGDRIPLQVKSSRRYMDSHRSNTLLRHIHCVCGFWEPWRLLMDLINLVDRRARRAS